MTGSRFGVVKPSVRSSWIAHVLGLALLFGSAAPARADNLDDELLKEGSTVVQKLKKQKYDSVGVLQFGLKIGDGKPVWNGGAINANLAQYLENALVLANDLDRPLTIIREANKEANKVDGANFETEQGRAALFQHNYPTWQGGTCKAGAFLWGRVDLSKDYKTAKINVCLSDPKKLAEPGTVLHQITVKSDQFLLADCGVGFSYSNKYKNTRTFGRGVLDSLIDQDTMGPGGGMTDPGPGNTNPGGPGNTGTGGTATVPGFPVQMKVLYDGAEQPFDRDLGTPPAASLGALSPTSYKLNQPRQGQKVLIKLKNLTDQKLGVVVMVAGTSTLNGHTNWKDSELWILKPNVEYTLEGFYTTGTGSEKSKVEPFKIESDEKSKELFHAKGEQAGQIALHVFRPGEKDAVLAHTGKRSLRMPTAAAGGRGVPKNADELTQAIKASQNGGITRGVIGKADQSEERNLNADDIGSVVQTDVMIVKYYTKDDAK